MEDGNTGHCIDSDSGIDSTRHSLVYKVRSKVEGQRTKVEGGKHEKGSSKTMTLLHIS